MTNIPLGGHKENVHPPIQVEPARTPTASELLTQHFTDREIGSESSFGSHRIKSFMACNRLAYLTYVRRLQPRQNSEALDIGTIIHACLARHYMTGGKDTWRPLEALTPELPETVAECRRLLVGYFARYAAEEARTWVVRAVEHEAKGQLTLGKRICPITCRYDLIITERGADGVIPPWDQPAPNGCWIIEHKTSRALTREYTQGYMFDFQIMTQALLWKLAGLDAVHGKLNGFFINILVKTKEPQFHRMKVAILDEQLDRFARSITPFAVDLWKRLQSKKTRADESQWPQNMAACKTQYGLCKMFDYCESDGRAVGLYETRK